MSQALVILGSTLVGILIMLPFDLIRRIKTSIKINELNNRIRKLNEELEQIKHSKESLDKKDEVQYDTNKNNEQYVGDILIKRWLSYDKDYTKVKDFVKELNISETLARILINRNVETIEDAKVFLNPVIDELHNSFNMKGMEATVC